MEEKKIFWIIAVVAALAAIAGAVAYFVTRYLGAREAEDMLDEYCDCDYDDCDCCSDEEEEAAPAEEKEEPQE